MAVLSRTSPRDYKSALDQHVCIGRRNIYFARLNRLAGDDLDRGKRSPIEQFGQVRFLEWLQVNDDKNRPGKTGRQGFHHVDQVFDAAR